MTTAADLLEGAGELAGKPLPPLINKGRAIVLNQADINALSKSLGRNVQTRDELLKAVSNMATIQVGGSEVLIEPYLLTRLRTRFPKRTDAEFHAALSVEIIRQLRTFAGI